MAIKGIIFDYQTPTAKGIRGGFHSALTDGILDGCAITYSETNLTIGSGLLNIAGGIVALTSSEVISVTGSSGYARIKAVIDLSGASNESAFTQVSFIVDNAATANGFPALIQNGINIGNGSVYEAEICVVSLGTNGITGLIRTAIASAKVQYGDTLPTDAPEGTIFLLKV